MSYLGKIRKNSENFILENVYKRMTPEQYQQGIQTAISITKRDLIKDFNEKYNKLLLKHKEDLRENTATIINTISVELLYELAVQMDAFNEKDEERLESIKYRIQEIYDNAIKSIEKYTTYKNNNQAFKKFNEKRKKIEKLFDLKF